MFGKILYESFKGQTKSYCHVYILFSIGRIHQKNNSIKKFLNAHRIKKKKFLDILRGRKRFALNHSILNTLILCIIYHYLPF